MNRNGILGWSGALAASAFMVAACGSSTSTSTSAATPAQLTPSSATTTASTTTGGGAAVDACALITEQEATAFLGSDPGRGTPTSGGGTTGCEYASILNVGVVSGRTSVFDTLRTARQGQQGFQDVSGVGDAAFLVIIPGSTQAAMYILKGSGYITIAINAPGVTPAALTALGTTIVGRL